MGKAARWFRGLLGGKKSRDSSSPSPAVSGTSDAKPGKEKNRWKFVRSFRDRESTAPPVNGDERRGSYMERSSLSSSYVDGVDSNKHAIAVAAASAAVAEAAVAAAQAAAEVVRLTSSGRCTLAYVSGNGLSLRKEDWAAVKIQAAFRGYLARRALRALKGLVKLQALVRGHIVRKKAALTLRCMQALVRVQARARAGRAHVSEPQHPKKASPIHHPGPATPEKYERAIRSCSPKHDQPLILKRNGSRPKSMDIIDLDRTNLGWNWLDHWTDERSRDYRREASMKTGPTDDEKNDKILEMDSVKPYLSSKRRNLFQSSRHTASDRYSQSFTTLNSPSFGEVQSRNPSGFPHEVEDAAFCTANNSPQFYSASSRPGSAKKGPFTPTKSDCSRSFLSGYSDHPNYMANTESFMAKVRSQSAPKHRPELEKSSSSKRYSILGFVDARSSAQRTSALHANFTSKAYPGSGRLDRLGTLADSIAIGF